ncbi:DUF5133 domain-containing protein [Streptomyces sp. NPDC092369]|uniref:DUF5133 domain-containing protein n=1 Tax=Streptomyces sp. NPDC092369 TaxID=3366015 RepID=UPI003801B3F5
MITPRPQVLRAQLSRYAEACARMLEADTPANRRTLEDAAYTLCVTTGTYEIKEALAAADRLLAEEQPNAAEGRPGADQDWDDQTLVA